jgi:hypothetical protein
MYAISQVSGREPGILIDDPNGRLSLVQALGPWYDGRVELLDLGVVVPNANGNDLGDLRDGYILSESRRQRQCQEPQGREAYHNLHL